MAGKRQAIEAARCVIGSRRRRGEQLEHAIFDAVIAELGSSGYDGMTMEGVACRARTGKAALYRRWSSKADLVVDALHFKLPPLDEPPDTGNVRDDLIECLSRMARSINSPAGCAVQSIMGNQQCDREMTRTVNSRVIQPRKQMMLDTLRRGAARGEVRPDAVTMLVAEVGPAMVYQRYVTEGPPITHEIVEGIVDQVVIPMLRP